MNRKLISTLRAVSPAYTQCLFVVLLVMLTITMAAPAWSAEPTASTAPASAAEEPRYDRAKAVSEDMMGHRPRQVIALPSEPGEAGEDPLQMSGGVIGKVPPDVHRFPEGYVIAGVRAILDSQPDWTVCYVPEARIVMSPAKESADWAKDLDAGRIPEGLSEACHDKGVQLATEAKAVVEEPGRFWHIVDPHRMLFVQQEPDAVLVRATLPLRILPNKTMMMLEAILSSGDKPPAFAITGRITEFQGHNYILLEHLSEVSASDSGPSAQTPAKSETTPPAANNSEVTASAPQGREARPEDIIKRLLDEKPRRAVVMPKEMPTVAESKSISPITEGRPEQQTWPEETMIVDRPGRIVPGDKWWQFSFEDKALVPGRKPIRVLPNRMLENAIAMGGDPSIGAILIVSGEVTEYRGANYLLIRKVLLQRDMGNLR